jgi:hypothetical protein
MLLGVGRCYTLGKGDWQMVRQLGLLQRGRSLALLDYKQYLTNDKLSGL